MATDDTPRPSGAPDISDRDVLDAMARIPGYLDISVEDFRDLYKVARGQALQRAFAHIRAGALMHTGIEPLGPHDMLDQAAHSMARQDLTAIPVVDGGHRVLGMLTETDFLQRLQAPGFLHLMLDLMENPAAFSHRCHETPVSAAMSSPVQSVPPDADFSTISSAFRRCGGRALPVVDGEDRLLGLLSSKDFMDACGLEGGA